MSEYVVALDAMSTHDAAAVPAAADIVSYANGVRRYARVVIAALSAALIGTVAGARWRGDRANNLRAI